MFGIKLRGVPSRAWSAAGLLCGFAGSVLAWQLLAMLMESRWPERAIFLPGPGQVSRQGWEMVWSIEFWTAVGVTNLRVVAGFVVAVALAIPLGIALGSYPQLEVLASPVTDFGRYLPVAALVPLLIIWAGVGDLQKILVLAIGTFFQVLVMVTDAVRRVPLMHVDTALTLGCCPRRVPFDVLLPAALPQIYDACRVGIGLTWSYLLVAEIVASENGLGYIIIRGQRFLRTDQIFFTVIVLGILGLAYDRAFTLPRRYLFRWAQEERQV
jgi:NitT/TauT family transport system permease protein